MTSISAGHYHAQAPDKQQPTGHRVGAKSRRAVSAPQDGTAAPERPHHGKYHGGKGHTHRTEHARGARLFHQAALQKFGHRAKASIPQPSISVTKSVAFYTSDPTEARDVAQSLLQTINGLLNPSANAPDVSAADVADGLAAAKTEARTLATTESEAEGVEDAAALVEQGLEVAADVEEKSAVEADNLIALKASRNQTYSLKVRTQEGDLVKISLSTSESLRLAQGAASESADGGDTTAAQDISIGIGARLNLRVYGDLNDSELQAIQNVFEQAAQVAQEFFDGDLAAALESSQAIEFDAAQIAKIRLHFRSRTSVSALYSQPAPVAVEPTDTTGESAEAPAVPIQSTEPGADSADEAAPETSAAGQTPPAASIDSDAASAGQLDEFADAIAAYFRSFIEGLEALQSNTANNEDSGYRLVTAFKLDVLKATIIASADEGQTEIAEQTAEAIEDAATTEAA